MADNPSNIVPDNLIVIEGGKQLVPAPAPSDAGKVLGVVNASGDIGWVEDQGGTLTQVQADWAETDPSKVSFIDNKPTIPSKTSDLQNDSGFITSSDIPAIPTKTSELQNDSGFITSASVPTKTSELQNDSGFITSADIPAIPTKTSDLQNDSGFITSSDIPAQVQSDWNEADANSAAYIKNKPTIPPGVTVDQTYNASSTNAQSGTAVAEAIANIPAAPTYSEGDGIDITNNVVSADVDGVTIGIDSTTHKIKSLQTIPTKTSDLQNDSGFITSSDIPAIPTKTSDLQNDSGFITSSDIPAQVQANWNESNSSSAAYIQNKPTIPAVDQTYNASSTNAQSGVAVASAVAGVNAVPASTSADEDKVLTVDSNGSPVWAASAVPASKPLVQGSGITITDGQNDVTISANVDQTYSASSTNAQSGVAVASAIAGINAVPASTSADQDKVLTVNSSGTPVWAAAQGGGGSGGDSEFPYDPGYMHTGWNKMIVRFGDTTYDPTTKASASSFTSIVALNEPGVYEYTFNLSSSHSSQLFSSEWTNITNNPIDILQLTSDDQLMGTYYGLLFYQCSGLRSVWNMRGYFGSTMAWFRGCSNLEIVSGKIPERIEARSNPSFDDVCVRLTYNSSYMFCECSNLKKVELVLGFPNTGSTNNLSYCFSDDTKLQVGGAIVGYASNTSYAYNNCTRMNRLYGLSDAPRLVDKFWDVYNPNIPDGAGSTLPANLSHMFSDCSALSDFNGVTLRYGNVAQMDYAFSACNSLSNIPSFNLDGTAAVSANGAFNTCVSLKQVPNIAYGRIKYADSMFLYCVNLEDLTPLVDIATTNLEDVDSMCQYTRFVSKGALELYNALSTNATNIQSHDGVFSDCGDNTWNNQRSQIPSSWGGTGA